MAEAVENSTSQMTDGDLNAIAVYLKALPPASRRQWRRAPMPRTQMPAGAGVYRVNCAACHGMDGKGEQRLFPPLAGNRHRAAVQRRKPGAGGAGGQPQARPRPKAPTGPAMPSFAWRLDDGQVADVLTYIRNSWGNGAGPVSADGVAQIRSRVKSGQ